MCAVQVVNTLTGYSLGVFGLLPRTIVGLPGIVTSPFLHGSWLHLIGNLLPFGVLSLMVCSDGLRRYVAVSATVILVGGGLVWVFGRGAYHVGASGWVFGLWVYVLARAWFQHSWGNLFTALVALVFYSGMLYGFIPRYGVSFESHIAGALAGYWAARTFATAPRRVTPKKES
ncbi:rhomboid family intramembrane serine protease [Pseudomonas sp. nanlin1]|uniref:rhomboid family intramembrane serine protease n=1 Tax=Pseudomonas sp. nanlin1 TaxID=3040605 RepID=UPI0038902AEA